MAWGAGRFRMGSIGGMIMRKDVRYKIEGEKILEVCKGITTGVWRVAELTPSIANQLIAKGGKEVQDFIEDEQARILADQAKEAAPEGTKVETNVALADKASEAPADKTSEVPPADKAPEAPADKAPEASPADKATEAPADKAPEASPADKASDEEQKK